MRIHPDRPIVGVGAVIVDGDRVVLIKRGHEPLKGEWSLPGGAVNVGETLEAAVMREIREETCLCRATGGALACATDADAAAWVRVDNLDSYRVARTTVDVIQKAVAL